MSPIRPLREQDLVEVAGLFERVMRSGRSDPAPGLVDAFRRFFLAGPNTDPEIPPLVFEGKDRIVGFLGTHVRPFVFDGAPVRVACSGQLVVDPESGVIAPGLQLMRHFLGGPQDLSLTDGATPTVKKMWERCGGCTNVAGGVRWTRILRPWRFTSAFLARRPRAGALYRPVDLLGRPLLAGLDALTRSVRFRTEPAPAEASPLDADGLAATLAAWPDSIRLRPAYDRAFAAWLLEELGNVASRGELRARRLERGFYAYYLARGGVASVLAVAAAPDDAAAVLAHLLHDADRGGAVAVQGRLEPVLKEPLACMGGSLQHANAYALVHSRRPELLAALYEGRALLTRLDGEWWNDFQLAGFREAPGRA